MLQYIYMNERVLRVRVRVRARVRVRVIRV